MLTLNLLLVPRVLHTYVTCHYAVNGYQSALYINQLNQFGEPSSTSAMFWGACLQLLQLCQGARFEHLVLDIGLGVSPVLSSLCALNLRNSLKDGGGYFWEIVC